MSKSKYGYPVHFFQACENLQKISAVWFFGDTTHPVLRILYYLHTFVWHAMGMVFILCEVVYLKETTSNINVFVGTISVFLTHLVGISKMVTIFRRAAINKIQNLLQNEEFYYEELEGFSPGGMVSEKKRSYSIMAYVIFFLYSMVGVSAHLSAVVNLEMDPGDHFPVNKTCYSYLPYYYYIPFRADTKFRCHVALLYLDLAYAYWAWIIASGDIMYVGMLTALTVQLKINCHVLKNIRKRALKQLEMPLDYAIMHDEDLPELDDELNRQLKHCVKHSQMLFKVRDDIEALFTFVVLSQTLVSILIYASCLYKASMLPMSSPEFWAQMEYFMCVLIQFFMLSYYGNEITKSSQEIGYYLYDADWFGCSKEFKNSMKIIMLRTQRPLFLTIGKFSPLNLSTFLSVCKGSFSYFALFKSI